MTRTIVVTKFGNEPNLFGSDLRHGMLGEWECFQLLHILSKDVSNRVIYYGKAIWDNKKAFDYFNGKVTYIESSVEDNAEDIVKLTKIDEFHIVLGPHAFYNAGSLIPSWESIKSSLVTQRLLERVAPQIKLVNASPDAQVFFYLSDRRFLLEASDIYVKHGTPIYSQCIDYSHYERFYSKEDYTELIRTVVPIQPFRFETLWLYEKEPNSYKLYKENKTNKFIIPVNQVTSDSELDNSRFEKVLNFTSQLKDFTICGKWTSEKAKQAFSTLSNQTHKLDGLEWFEYNNELAKSEYALVLFNTKDSPKRFIDNWITVKYWECIHNGCITFVEAEDKSILSKLIPEEFLVSNGIELAYKFNKCESDSDYKEHLYDLQSSLLSEDYYTGKYFNDWIKQERERYASIRDH